MNDAKEEVGNINDLPDWIAVFSYGTFGFAKPKKSPDDDTRTLIVPIT